MNNLEYLMEHNQELLLDMVADAAKNVFGGHTDTTTPWCMANTGECDDCGICRRKWLEAEHVERVENKEQFVYDVVDALINNGAGRYDYLMSKPCYYRTGEYDTEFITRGHQEVHVTGDSLLLIMSKIAEMLR